VPVDIAEDCGWNGGDWRLKGFSMPSRRHNRRFRPKDYWASRPYCSQCGERKTRSGNICHKCRTAGHTEALPLDQPTRSTRIVQPAKSTVPTTKTEAPPFRPAEQMAKPAEHKPDVNRYPFWAVFIGLASLVLWAGISSGNGADFNVALLALVFGVPVWAAICHGFLNDTDNLFEALAGISIFFWPLTLMLIVWLLAQLF
jgi:hypothetical protein